MGYFEAINNIYLYNHLSIEIHWKHQHLRHQKCMIYGPKTSQNKHQNDAKISPKWVGFNIKKVVILSQELKQKEAKRWWYPYSFWLGFTFSTKGKTRTKTGRMIIDTTRASLRIGSKKVNNWCLSKVNAAGFCAEMFKPRILHETRDHVAAESLVLWQQNVLSRVNISAQNPRWMKVAGAYDSLVFWQENASSCTSNDADNQFSALKPIHRPALRLSTLKTSVQLFAVHLGIHLQGISCLSSALSASFGLFCRPLCLQGSLIFQGQDLQDVLSRDSKLCLVQGHLCTESCTMKLAGAYDWESFSWPSLCFTILWLARYNAPENKLSCNTISCLTQPLATESLLEQGSCTRCWPMSCLAPNLMMNAVSCTRNGYSCTRNGLNRRMAQNGFQTSF